MSKKSHKAAEKKVEEGGGTMIEGTTEEANNVKTEDGVETQEEKEVAQKEEAGTNGGDDKIKTLVDLLSTVESRLKDLETKLTAQPVATVPAAVKPGNGQQRFGTAHVSKGVLDTVTGIKYKSLYGAGLAFTSEFPGIDKRYLWYKALAKYGEGDGKRFKIQ